MIADRLNALVGLNFAMPLESPCLIPSDIAEYIQASSRVGRTHVGFSLLVPVPQRYRDRFVLETWTCRGSFTSPEPTLATGRSVTA